MSLKLHLACGNNVIPGWINIDGSPGPGKTQADLTKPLQYADRSVAFIYTEHFIEHLTREQGIEFLKECRRILKNEGVIRISTPDLSTLVNDFVCNKLDRWSSLGWKPESRAQLVNEGMRLWGHLYLYDRGELVKSLSLAGFDRGFRKQYKSSTYPELAGLESRPDCDDLIYETSPLF